MSTNTRKKLQERDSNFSKDFIKGVDEMAGEGNPSAQSIIKRKRVKRDEKSVTVGINVDVYRFLLNQRMITESTHKDLSDLRASSVTSEAKNCIEFCHEISELLGEADYRTATRNIVSKKKEG